MESAIQNRAPKESVIAVLEGIKASKDDDKSVAPLSWACRNVLKAGDALLVLVILYPRCDNTGSSRRRESLMLLHRQMQQRREMYRRILRPFYDRCKELGVKFEAKVAAVFEPNAILMQAARNADATWIVMDKCLAENDSLKLHKEKRTVAVVDGNEEAEIYHFHTMNGQIIPVELDAKPNSGSPENQTESIPNVSYSIQNSPGNESAPREGNQTLQTWNVVENPVEIPVDMSSEETLEIPGCLQSWPYVCEGEDFIAYKGTLRDPPNISVMVKQFFNDADCIIEAEKLVVSYLAHQNILRPIAYHESVGMSALVYQYTGIGTLDQHLNYEIVSPQGLTCPERMKIAIQIGRGMRYMHEECHNGPAVHGNLRLCNVFLEHDYQPLISGFGRTRWLKLEQMEMDNTHDRCWYDMPLDTESMVLIKKDVYAFGVLLLRLFCQRPLPEDDEQLVQWARPLLQRGAFHQLLDQDIHELDMYDMYKVLSVASLCTKRRPLSRPSMTQVLSILRGEHSCAVQSSPSSDGSLDHITPCLV